MKTAIKIVQAALNKDPINLERLVQQSIQTKILDRIQDRKAVLCKKTMNGLREDIDVDKVNLEIDKIEGFSDKQKHLYQSKTMEEQVKLLEGIIDQLNDIVKSGTLTSVALGDGSKVQIDTNTAHAILAVYAAATDQNKGKMAGMLGDGMDGFNKMADFAWSIVGA